MAVYHSDRRVVPSILCGRLGGLSFGLGYYRLPYYAQHVWVFPYRQNLSASHSPLSTRRSMASPRLCKEVVQSQLREIWQAITRKFHYCKLIVGLRPFHTSIDQHVYWPPNLKGTGLPKKSQGLNLHAPACFR